MSRRSFIGNLVTGLGAEGLGETLKEFCSACASGDGTKVAAAIGGITGGPLVAVGILAGGAALQLAGDRRKAREQQEQFEALARRVEACRGDVMLLTDLLVERSTQPGSIIAQVAATDVESLQRELTDAVRDALRPLLPEGSPQPDWDGVFVYLETNTHLMRELGEAVAELKTDVREGFERIEAQLPSIADMQEKLLTMSDANAQLASQVADLGRQNATLHDQLINANRELAEQRVAAGRSVDEVLAELREIDPRELYEFLVDTVNDEENEFAQQRAKLIARHREIAAIGYPLGRIDQAEQSLRRILDLLPEDPDAVTRLGHIHLLRGDLDEAASSYRRLLDRTGDEVAQAVALGNLGVIERARGNLGAAEDYHTRSLAINERLGRQEGMASTLGNLGVIERTRGNLDAACTLWRRSLELFRRVGAQPQIDVVQDLLAEHGCEG